MGLTAGTRLGQYEVRELFGQGGMGKVGQCRRRESPKGDLSAEGNTYGPSTNCRKSAKASSKGMTRL